MSQIKSPKGKRKSPEDLQIPPDLNPTEVLAVINRILDKLARSFSFGYFDEDDIRQEATIKAIKALQKYDRKRNLANFLYIHIKRRLFNLKRDKYKRVDAPCVKCHNRENGETEHRDGEYCERHLGWVERNAVKHSLMYPEKLEQVGEPLCEGDFPNDLLHLIDLKMPADLRAAYLKMRSGALSQVSKTKREQVTAIVLSLLNNEYSPQNQGFPPQTPSANSGVLGGLP